jgi:formylglycine-generating enzyme required for sulfatase activity
MARLIAASVTAALLLALLVSSGRGWVGSRYTADQGPALGQEREQADFKAAGVCARCHVVSVLEWGISGHVAAKTTCQRCHGPSKEHVANERNEVKPDRLPRGAQIARMCMDCHDGGCPKTQQAVSCQKCHHVHALIDRAKRPQAQDERLTALHRRWEQFGHHMEAGERQVQRGRWEAAQKEFQEALRLIPGNHRAAMRLALCKRRQHPAMKGFTITGSRFDPQTGLPTEVVVTGLDLPMVLVPPGEFDLGADHLPDARPVHTVAIEAFYLGQWEVTQAQWKAIMGTNPSVHQGRAFADAEKMPVENISWDDCQAFLKRLNERVPGGGFRLPTEAEWEYACRAGGEGPDPKRLGEFTWFRENSLRQPSGETAQKPDAWAPRPVGTKRPNRWGLYDMQGNVSEWCSSLWQPYPFDPRDGRESPDRRGQRVLRGGHFADSVESLDPALRHAERTHRRLRWNGLRLARTVVAAQM